LAVVGGIPLQSVVFYELLGLPKDRAKRAEREARAWLEGHPAQRPTCKPGLSPHAPYSVRASLFEAAFQMARSHQLPLATHLAETREELELLEHHRGPFVRFSVELVCGILNGLVHDPKDIFPTINAPDESSCHSRKFTCRTTHHSHSSLITHSPSPTVVYCPRTHASFGHDGHPFREILARGRNNSFGN